MFIKWPCKVKRLDLINSTIPSCSYSRHFRETFTSTLPSLNLSSFATEFKTVSFFKRPVNNVTPNYFYYQYDNVTHALWLFSRMNVTAASYFIPRDHSRNEINLCSVLYRNHSSSNWLAHLFVLACELALWRCGHSVGATVSPSWKMTIQPCPPCAAHFGGGVRDRSAINYSTSMHGLMGRFDPAQSPQGA